MYPHMEGLYQGRLYNWTIKHKGALVAGMHVLDGQLDGPAYGRLVSGEIVQLEYFLHQIGGLVDVGA